MFSQFQDDIHTKVNIQLSYKLNNNNVNTPLFKNQRLERIKTKGRLTDPLAQTYLQQNQQYTDQPKHRKSEKNSDFDISTHNQTNYMTYVKSSRKEDKIFRPLTSKNPNRNYRKNQKRKYTNTSVAKSMRIMSLQQEFNVKKKNLYEQIQKKNNKGPLQIKHMQNWLNDILIQYCYQQKFDPTIQNPALKKYQIDRNSLLSRGVNNQKIDRIFRSLFVYSIGFNHLLQQLTQSKNSSEIRKTIWKVYAMLIQYCAKGQFQTMVGQIERDKLKKIQNLKQQIQKRQKIIDQSEQLDRERNILMHKQIKKLKQQNQNLLNQKAIIQEDFKQADQAFNQQVALRLKFQHKINQINGVHRQLGIKHMRLYEDFNAYKIQYGKMMEQKRKQTLRLQELLAKILKIQQQNQKLKIQVQDQSKIIQTCQYRLQFFNKKSTELQVKGFDQYANEKQRQRQINLLKFQIDNAKGIIKLKQNALIDQYKQVELLIQENRNLFQKIEQQKIKIEEFGNLQYKYQLTTLNIKTSYDVLDQKHNKTIIQLTKFKSENQKLHKNVNLLQNQLDMNVQKVKILENDIENYIANIQNMKKAKNSLEDQLFTIKQRNLTMTEIIQNKEIIEFQLTKKLNEALSDLLKVKTQLSDTQSRMKFLEDSLNHQKSLIAKKYEKLKIERQQLMKIDAQRKQLMIVLQAQNQKCKRQEAEIKSKLRDQIFQRSNLELKYKQSLLVMQDQNKYIKQLNITMSHLKQQKQSVKRQLKSTQFVLQQRTEQYKKQVQMLNNQVQNLKKQIQRKNEWIHPMYYWDMHSLLTQTNNSKQQLQKYIEDLKMQILNNQNTARMQINQIKQQFQHSKNKYVANYEKMIKDLQRQIKNLEENKQQAFIEASQLKTTMKKYQQYFNASQNPKEKALQVTIKQKSQKLESLIKQNQILQDKNIELSKNLLNSNKEIIEIKKDIDKNKNLLAKFQVQNRQLNQMRYQNQNLRKKLDQAQQNYSIILQELKKARQQALKNKVVQKISQDFNQFKQIKVKQQENRQQKIPSERKSSEMNEEFELKRMNDFEFQEKLEKIKKNEKVAEKQSDKKQKMNVKEQISRKQIVKKIKGAFNYYNKISK